jgi:hypothetical protein
MNITIPLAAAFAVLAVARPALAENAELSNFVHQTHMHGVPYDAAIRLDPEEAVPALLKMLQDPKEEQYWPNIVITLGMLGDQRAIAPLIKFLEADPGRELSRPHYIAKTGVVMALGYSIHRKENSGALKYLIESAKPNVWSRRKLTWISPDHPQAEGRDEQLSTMAILGLALSGHPYAWDALIDLRQPAADARLAKFQSRVAPVIAEAISAHEKIAGEGMSRYIANGMGHR